MSGLRAGETALVRDDGGNVVLTYRSFASVVGIVAALVSGIVFVAGAAATLFLLAEGAPLRALAVLALTIAFSVSIALLMPRAHVTLYDSAGQPALTIEQRSAFPSASYVVGTPDNKELAILRHHFLARLGRNRWRVGADSDAVEESLSRAFTRKLLGKFSRRFEANIRIRRYGAPAGTIIRRGANKDALELVAGTIDPRIALALATVILGSEP